MTFKECLALQLKNHPSMEPRDVVKMCYQAAYGAEHLLSDIDKARRYFEEEFRQTEAAGGPLFEDISEEICRVNMASWKAAGLSSDLLFEVFVSSFGDMCKNQENLLKYIGQAEGVLAQTQGFDMKKWENFLKDYKASGMKALHHSQVYREKERPAYRIVKKTKLVGTITKAGCESYL